MSICRALCLTFVVCVPALFVRAADEGPAADVPELKVLQQYVGTWDVLITLPGGGDQLKAESTTKWILNGRYVEQSGTLHLPDGTDTKMTTLMTYDAKKRTYRTWTFVSDGGMTEADATWDAQTKTMTSIGKKDENGAYSIVTADFSADGRESWRIEGHDAGGNVSFEVRGVNTRRPVAKK